MKQQIKLIISDVDGVLVTSDLLHFHAWKEAIADSEYLKQMGPLTIEEYRLWIDGRSREDGLKQYLQMAGKFDTNSQQYKSVSSRILNKKNKIFLDRLNSSSISPYPEVKACIRQWRNEKIHIAALSASKNCHKILNVAGLENTFDGIYEGRWKTQKNLKNKSEMCLAICHDLQVTTNQTALLEDSLAGIEEGAKAHLDTIIALNRRNEIPDSFYYARGATKVVKDLRRICR